MCFFLPPAQLDCPKTIELHPAHQSPSTELPRLYIPRRALVFLVGCCVCNSVREPSKATKDFFVEFLFPFNSTPGSRRQHPPTRSALAASPPQCPPQRRRRLIFDCCVTRIKGGHLRPRVCPSLYFLSLHSNNQTTSNRPPHTFQPSRISSPMHPLKGEADFLVGCCVPPSIGGQLRPRHPPLSLFRPPPFKSPPKRANQRQRVITATTRRIASHPTCSWGQLRTMKRGGLAPESSSYDTFCLHLEFFLLLMCVTHMTHSYPTGRKCENQFSAMLIRDLGISKLLHRK